MQDVIIIGAGAAGCFAAAVLARASFFFRTISILEKTRQPLAKVKISGGGRCNVTHHCFEEAVLVNQYPRGKDFMRGALSRFQPRDMVVWLEEQGVKLKVEEDGRMFPSTNRSQTIVDCFLHLLSCENIPLLLEKEVVKLTQVNRGWEIALKDGSLFESRKVLVTTGGNAGFYRILEELGLIVEKPIPSLFTFNLKEDWIKELSGSSVPRARVSIEGTHFSFVGPLLVTHWGLSGPAILKLSAFAAKWLFDVGYQAVISVNWTGDLNELAAKEELLRVKQAFSERFALATPCFSLSKNLWRALLLQLSPALEKKVWGRISKQELDMLSRALTSMPFHMISKSVNKEEFVTCGGVSLDEISQKTMESKKKPGLYFAGEVLNIDGITGGFNFQNAWTGGWIAAHAIIEALEKEETV